MDGITLSEEAKATMIANLQLESKSLFPTNFPSFLLTLLVNARIEKLRAMCDAQCASLRSRLERRVNRVPANKRQTPIIELISPSIPEPKAAIVKKFAPATATRKTRTAAAPTKVVATKPAPAKPATKQTTRGKKRSSDEISSEDKENALAVTKKRVRTAAAPKPAPTTKAPAPRTTRAASKQKPAAVQILSPKNNNARQKTTKSATRPR